MEASNNDTGIEFFSAVDRNPATGEIKSHLPAWWHERQVEELKDSIYSKEQFISKGRVGAEHVQSAIAELDREKSNLREIESAKPKFNAKQKDLIAKGVSALSELIGESLHSQKDLDRKIVDTHEEANRMVNPCISIKKNPELASFAEACNVPISRKGEISRDSATKMAHIMSKSLGERFFVEALRR